MYCQIQVEVPHRPGLAGLLPDQAGFASLDHRQDQAVVEGGEFGREISH